MNKKIKLIELLNRIYANLDVPEKVKYNDKKYEYNKATQDYECEDEWLFQRILTFFGRWTEREVEILEDEEEIDIQDIEKNKTGIEFAKTELFTAENLNFYFETITKLINKERETQNKLVKAVKQLDKKINKED